jgi:hypothetical protein
MWGDSESECESETGPYLDTKSDCNLILNFPNSRTVRNILLCIATQKTKMKIGTKSQVLLTNTKMWKQIWNKAMDRG